MLWLRPKKKELTIICHAEERFLTEIDTRLAENTMTWRDISFS